MTTGIIAIAAGLAIGLAAIGIAVGQGMLASKAMESMGKQPEAMSGIRTSMIIAMAIMETIGVLTFVIAIVLAARSDAQNTKCKVKQNKEGSDMEVKLYQGLFANHWNLLFSAITVLVLYLILKHFSLKKYIISWRHARQRYRQVWIRRK